MTPDNEQNLADQKREALNGCSSAPESIVAAQQKVREANANALEKAGYPGLLNINKNTEKPQYSLDE